MTTREHCTMLLNQGLSCTEIAQIVGVTRQRVYQICGEYDGRYFKKITEKQCVYPNWRNWMNDNRISKNEFVRRMGLQIHATTIARLSSWMIGRTYPSKSHIDMVLDVTGLTYEQLFYREGD